MFGRLEGTLPTPPVARRQRSPTLPTTEATMRCVRQASVGAALTLAFASSGWYSGAVAQDPRSALDPITSAVMKHPITTSSATARDHFLRGQRELDLARFIDANAHFKRAVAADPSFAFAYLNVANTANSLDEFKTNLAQAEQHAAGASDAERLQIQMARKGFDNDLVGQLALGRQLVEKYPDSPRAWLALAGVQGALNYNAEARTSIAKALDLAPRLFAAHTALGLSYLFGEPRDFAKALQSMQQAEALAPDEAGVHTLLGDVYRAQRNLAKAREEYTRGHRLNPRDAILLVKAGHANTFLGDYVAARADYDSAIAVGRANEKAAYAQKQADQIGELLAPDANPRKLEPMHQLEGFIALYQGKYREAAGHLKLGNTLDPYVKYQLAVATEGAGDAAQAKRLFTEVAEYNFNTIGFALVRKDAQQKAGAGTL